MTTKKGLLYEQWFFVNDSTLQNRSYRLHGLDTIPQETVTLKIRGGSITYNSTVADENNQLPVTFTLTSRLQGKYLFENQSHDFPQFIRYQLLGEHKLSAAISGKMNGNFREVLFMYDREL